MSSERDATPTRPDENLAPLARRSIDLVAGPLFDYQDSKHLTDEQLADVVGVAVEDLPHLALSEWPKSAQEITAIASYADADIKKLAAWLKEQEEASPR